jgi:hypothetical protein
MQWILAWRPPGKSGHERVLFLFVLIPVLAICGCMMAFSMFTLGFKTSADPLILNRFLTGMGLFLFLCFFASLVLERNSTLWFDFSQLFHMPLRPAEIVLSQVFGYATHALFMAFPALMFLASTAGILASGKGALALAALVGSALWCLQTSLALVAGEILRLHVRFSRKVARVLSLAGLLLTFGGLMGWLTIHRTAAEDQIFASLMKGIARFYLANESWLTLLPGISPMAWVGRGWVRGGALLAALLEIGVFAWISIAMMKRLMKEGRASSVEGTRIPKADEGFRRVAPWQRLRLWPLWTKEFRCFFRERYQVLGVGSMALMVFVLPKLVEGLGGWVEVALRVGIPLGLAGMWALGTLNQFGLESGALSMWMTSPMPRWRLLFAKNLVGFAIMAFLLGAHEIVRLSQGAAGLGVASDFLLTFGAVVILVGIGNFFSILLPYPAAIPGKNLFPQTSQTRLMVISLFQILYMAVTGYALLPVIAGRFALAVFADAPRIWWFTAGTMVAYAGVFYGILVSLASRMMLRLEPRMFERLQRSNG